MKKVTRVSVNDLQEIIQRHEPDILHFSVNSNEGTLMFEGVDGEAELVDHRALSDLLRIVNSDGTIKCVLFNTSDSASLAVEAAKHTLAAISMNGGITDKAAIIFATAFYLGLSSGKSVKEAFELGRNQLHLTNTKEEHILESHYALGSDPSELYLLPKVPRLQHARATMQQGEALAEDIMVYYNQLLVGEISVREFRAEEKKGNLSKRLIDFQLRAAEYKLNDTQKHLIGVLVAEIPPRLRGLEEARLRNDYKEEGVLKQK